MRWFRNLFRQYEKPRAPKGMDCPHWKKDRSKVCHTCEFWVRLYGRNPNPKDPHTVETIDDWRCAVSWGPVLQTQLAYEVACISKEMSEQRKEVLPAMQGVFHSTQIAASASQALTKAIAEASQERVALPATNGHHATKLIEG